MFYQEETLFRRLETELSTYCKSSVSILKTHTVGGGCINHTQMILSSGGSFFIKKNRATAYPGMFEKEAMGLEHLEDCGCIRTPKVICFGSEGENAFLLLEYIASGKQADGFWRDFGASLANLHKNSHSHFGLSYENYIGSLVQINQFRNTWHEFFISMRLEPQLKLARDQNLIDGGMIRKFDLLFPKLTNYFPHESPALLHGDLWNGNYMCSDNGEACLIDPAIYFGHREVDLAMSFLFGGFSSEFYEAYHNEYPLETDWKERMDLYNLYPLLVHVNLFGGSYAGQVKSVINQYV